MSILLHKSDSHVCHSNLIIWIIFIFSRSRYVISYNKIKMPYKLEDCNVKYDMLPHVSQPCARRITHSTFHLPHSSNHHTRCTKLVITGQRPSLKPNNAPLMSDYHHPRISSRKINEYTMVECHKMASVLRWPALNTLHGLSLFSLQSLVLHQPRRIYYWRLGCTGTNHLSDLPLRVRGAFLAVIRADPVCSDLE